MQLPAITFAGRQGAREWVLAVSQMLHLITSASYQVFLSPELQALPSSECHIPPSPVTKLPATQDHHS
jgi:hypothetical protein